MLNRVIAGLAAVALGVSLASASLFFAEAAPPEREVNLDPPALSEGCVALITWEPLRGGKPMFARVILRYLNDSGGYSPVLHPGADSFHKVKQNAGMLEVDFGELAAAQLAPGYRVEVNFVDGKDAPMSAVMAATSDCAETLPD